MAEQKEVQLTQVHKTHLSEFIKSVVRDNKKFYVKTSGLPGEDTKPAETIKKLQDEDYIRESVNKMISAHPKNEHLVYTVPNWKEVILNSFSIKRIKSNMNRKAESQKNKRRCIR